MSGRFPDRRLRVMPLLGGEPRVFLSGNVVNVTLANNGAMRTFDITPDGKQTVFVRLRENSEIVLIDLPK